MLKDFYEEAILTCIIVGSFYFLYWIIRNGKAIRKQWRNWRLGLSLVLILCIGIQTVNAQPELAETTPVSLWIVPLWNHPDNYTDVYGEEIPTIHAEIWVDNYPEESVKNLHKYWSANGWMKESEKEYALPDFNDMFIKFRFLCNGSDPMYRSEHQFGLNLTEHPIQPFGRESWVLYKSNITYSEYGWNLGIYVGDDPNENINWTPVTSTETTVETTTSEIVYQERDVLFSNGVFFIFGFISGLGILTILLIAIKRK